MLAIGDYSVILFRVPVFLETLLLSLSVDERLLFPENIVMIESVRSGGLVRRSFCLKQQKHKL